MKKLRKTFWLFSLTSTALTIYGGVLSGSTLALAFARGRSLKLDLILNPNPNAKIGKSIVLAIAILLQMASVMEVGCYIEIYRKLYQHDTTVAKKVCPSTLRSRRKRNITNLSGQVISFAIEFTTGILINSMLAFESHASLFPIYLSIASTLVSMSQFFTSGELRRHYLGSKWVID